MSKNKYSIFSKRPRRYIYQGATRHARRQVSRPLLVVLALVLVAGLAVPVAMARQQPDGAGGSTGAPQTYWPQQTSGVSTSREAQKPDAPPSAMAKVQAQAAAAAKAAETAKAAQAAQAKAAATGIPAQVLDLRHWKIALPVDTPHTGQPDEIKQPELSNFVLPPYFYTGKGGVIFQAHAGGATTKNSSYPRSELREMSSSGGNAAWSNTSGTHTMTIRQAIMATPSAKPHVVAGQIHDGSDDVVMVRLEGKHLFVEADGTPIGTLQEGYVLGTPFTVKIETSGGQIRVFYNDLQKVSYDRPGSGFFFKAGVYTQSNPSKGESPDSYGQVVIYALQVTHN
jgi:poly(beta-D-mannuronate) lyase